MSLGAAAGCGLNGSVGVKGHAGAFPPFAAGLHVEREAKADDLPVAPPAFPGALQFMVARRAAEEVDGVSIAA